MKCELLTNKIKTMKKRITTLILLVTACVCFACTQSKLTTQEVESLNQESKTSSFDETLRSAIREAWTIAYDEIYVDESDLKSRIAQKLNSMGLEQGVSAWNPTLKSTMEEYHPSDMLVQVIDQMSDIVPGEYMGPKEYQNALYAILDINRELLTEFEQEALSLAPVVMSEIVVLKYSDSMGQGTSSLRMDGWPFGDKEVKAMKAFWKNRCARGILGGLVAGAITGTIVGAVGGAIGGAIASC